MNGASRGGGGVRRWLSTVGALLLWTSGALPLGAQDPESREAVPSILRQQLRSTRAETKLTALRKLESYPTADAAKLLIEHGLSSPVADVRRRSDLFF